MRILVTGGAGYIGAVLCDQLLYAGHNVRVVDALHWGLEPLADLMNECDGRFEVVRGDIRDFDDEWLAGIDGVAHLAGLSNDPTADFDPQLNRTVNALGTKKVVDACVRMGVKRFTFASSASIYDRDDIRVLTAPVKRSETDPVRPVGNYSISKHRAEGYIMQAAAENERFEPVILRQGTVHGVSTRMRFDLVVNSFVRDGLRGGEIFVHGDGSNWRPVVDVQHVAAAHVRALEAPSDKLTEIVGKNKRRLILFNVMDCNRTVRDIAYDMVQAFHKCGIRIVVRNVRNLPGRRVRNYRMDGSQYAKVFGATGARTIGDSACDMIGLWHGREAAIMGPEFENITWMKLRSKEPAA